ncbi:MAG: CaiB/BaiF CoA-transferase family protein, partial [Pseudomonadota bacterium]
MSEAPVTDETQNDTTGHGPLKGITVVDLTRILAGPTMTQLLGDLGADVIKIERPGAGDDTRKWGPPFVTGKDGQPTRESAYYLSANRNKRSVAIDIARPEGADLVRRLAASADVLTENFKVGGLKKYGLGYDDLKTTHPHLIYCSITGFGQTGPYASQAGYDYLAQGMSGIMSVTGTPDGEPMKVGVGIADVVCGLYASNAVMAALLHRHQTGRGQHIDVALLDATVSWLINEGTNYLVSGNVPKRRGNAHPNIVPYQLFETQDGYFILAVGNDGQFARFCAVIGHPELAEDVRFATNPARLENRDALVEILKPALRAFARDWIIEELSSRGVPAGPVNDIGQA